MLILCVILAAICLYKIKWASRGFFFQDTLSLSATKPYRGLFAVVIMLAHLQGFIGKNDVFDILLGLAYILVGYFYFMSGFGLYTGVCKKPNYAKAFLPMRVASVYLPYVLTNLVYIFYATYAYSPFKAPEFLRAMFSPFFLINGTAWYVISILIFYIAFYFIFRVLKGKMALWGIGAFTAGYILFCLVTGKQYYWYASCFTFWGGALLAQFKDKLNLFAQKYYFAAVGGCVAIWLIGQKYSALGKAIGGPWLECLFFIAACSGFCATVVLISKKVQIGNGILSFLSEISLELYLVHTAFLRLFRLEAFYIENKWTYIIVAFACSFGAATLLHWLVKYILCVIKNMGKQNEGKI
ncbi:MAG: acyltransferase [Oscillospiraceae bacterium]|nr:acyltransferase [Oscillospiraceae bacterium]